MSTRSIIVVTGKSEYKRDETVRLYKHSDGYPTGNLPIIADAIKKAQTIVDQENERFKNIDSSKYALHVGLVSGAVISESLSYFGIGASIDDGGQFSAPFKPEHLGNQGDLEWIYIVDLNAKTVNVYGGGYTGKAPQAALQKGVVDPVKYVKQLIEECQDNERQEILKAIAAIEETGFKVNAAKSKGRAKAASKPAAKAKRARLALV